MQKPLFRKNEDPSIADLQYQNQIIEETKSPKDLVQKELTINKLYQQEIQKRIHILKESIKNLPQHDPNITFLMTQLEMDRIELDELKIREKNLQKNI